jgi:hypothetical protein
MISNEEIGDQKDKVDIWALGVLAYCIIDEVSPFNHEPE